MKRLLAAFVAGVVFGIGLVLARMTDPTVVLGVLDVFGAFDPTLLVVMASAVATSAIGYRFVRGRAAPVFEARFQIPAARHIDRPLVLGAVLFGVGWGLAGYCPGPALVALASGIGTAWVFVPAMLVGSALQVWSARR